MIPRPAARMGDLHVCGMVPPPGAPIVGPCAMNVLIGGRPAARVTDACACSFSPDLIVRGSNTVMIGGLPAARVGDATAKTGVIVTGMPNVLIGG